MKGWCLVPLKTTSVVVLEYATTVATVILENYRMNTAHGFIIFFNVYSVEGSS